MSEPGDRLSETELVRLVLRLITAGHGSGVWDYGISFFKAALECLDDYERQRLRNFSMAMRAAEFDEKGWSRWIASLDNPALGKKVTKNG